MQRQILSLVLLFLANAMVFSQSDTLLLGGGTSPLVIPGKKLLDCARTDYLTANFHDQKSHYLEFLTGDTLIVVTDKWNLFRNPLNRLKRYDIETYYTPKRYVLFDDDFPFRTFCILITESGLNVVNYDAYPHRLCNAIFGVPGSEWGPARVGDSVEELFSNLQWSSPAIESFSTIVFVHPEYVSGWWKDFPGSQFLPVEAFSVVRVRMDQNRKIESIELGDINWRTQSLFESIYDDWEYDNQYEVTFDEFVRRIYMRDGDSGPDSASPTPD